MRWSGVKSGWAEKQRDSPAARSRWPTTKGSFTSPQRHRSGVCDHPAHRDTLSRDDPGGRADGSPPERPARLARAGRPAAWSGSSPTRPLRQSGRRRSPWHSCAREQNKRDFSVTGIFSTRRRAVLRSTGLRAIPDRARLLSGRRDGGSATTSLSLRSPVHSTNFTACRVLSQAWRGERSYPALLWGNKQQIK